MGLGHQMKGPSVHQARVSELGKGNSRPAELLSSPDRLAELFATPASVHEPADAGKSGGAAESTGPTQSFQESSRKREVLLEDSSLAAARETSGVAQEGRPQSLPSREELLSIAARLIVFGFTGKGPTLNKHAKSMIARGERAACPCSTVEFPAPAKT